MSAEKKPTTTVRVTRRFESSPEKVFDAWLDQNNAGKWFFKTPAGVMKRVEIDARAGGKFFIAEQRGDVLAEHAGEYLEIDRPRRLKFSFAVPTVELTYITIDIIPSGSGCGLTLTHEGVWAEYAEKTKQGWIGILEGLARTVEI